MKILNYLMLAVALMFVTSCSNSHEAEQVAEKIQKSEKLQKGDYTTIIEYLGNYAQEAQKYQDIIDDADPNSEEAATAAKKLTELTENHKYIKMFSEVLANTTAEEVGAENVTLVNNYAPLIWFNSPSWAGFNEAPDGSAGLIMDAPSDSDSAVIATGVEEKTVKTL